MRTSLVIAALLAGFFAGRLSMKQDPNAKPVEMAIYTPDVGDSDKPPLVELQASGEEWHGNNRVWRVIVVMSDSTRHEFTATQVIAKPD